MQAMTKLRYYEVFVYSDTAEYVIKFYESCGFFTLPADLLASKSESIEELTAYTPSVLMHYRLPGNSHEKPQYLPENEALVNDEDLLN